MDECFLTLHEQSIKQSASFICQTPFGVKETKVDEQKVPPEFKNIEGYPHSYWFAAEKAGYSR